MGGLGLSRDLLASLFASVGIGAELFASVMRMQKQPAPVPEEGSAVISLHSLLHPAQPTTALGQAYYGAWIETDWQASFSSQIALRHPPFRLLTDASTCDVAWAEEELASSRSSTPSASELGERSGFTLEEKSWEASGASRPVPSVHRQWSYRKLLIIQMELCEGHTLRDYVDKRNAGEGAGGSLRGGGGGVVEGECLNLLRQVAVGLEHVHACGLVHRDIKPSNLCFSGGVLKLVDFGLAKPYGEQAGEHVQLYRRRSNNTEGVGTPSYAAPEQLRGGEVSAAADMVSLGRPLVKETGVGSPPLLPPITPPITLTPRRPSALTVIPYPDIATYHDYLPARFPPLFRSAMERAKVVSQPINPPFCRCLHYLYNEASSPPPPPTFQAFEALRQHRIPPSFTSFWPRLSQLLGRLLSESPADRPCCSKVLREID
ncbi:MAG: hypothetical protein SGPRY_006776, partial [Prymnesium sp.]